MLPESLVFRRADIPDIKCMRIACKKGISALRLDWFQLPFFRQLLFIASLIPSAMGLKL